MAKIGVTRFSNENKWQVSYNCYSQSKSWRGTAAFVMQLFSTSHFREQLLYSPRPNTDDIFSRNVRRKKSLYTHLWITYLGCTLSRIFKLTAKYSCRERLGEPEIVLFTCDKAIRPWLPLYLWLAVGSTCRMRVAQIAFNLQNVVWSSWPFKMAYRVYSAPWRPLSENSSDIKPSELDSTAIYPPNIKPLSVYGTLLPFPWSVNIFGFQLKK